MFAVMDSLRKWLYKPRRDDTSLLAQFFFADEALNRVAAELDSFDGRKDPRRCTTLVNNLRQCQDTVLNICNRIMDEMIPNERASRDFRVKFPDDVMQDNLAGQLWFGAECLAAGSSIMNREVESGAMRPLAKQLTKSLEAVRCLLREAALHSGHSHEIQTERLTQSLKLFDRLLAEFELAYVSAMVPVKTVQEYELQQCVVVLFSETLQRALKMGLLSQEMVDQYDPALMFTIPRLAIVSGLFMFPHGPLSLTSPTEMSEMFRPFWTLLVRIRELLWTLTEDELLALEKMLCSSEDPSLPPQSHHLCPDTSQAEVEEDRKFWTENNVTGQESKGSGAGDIPTPEGNKASQILLTNHPEGHQSPEDSGFVQSNSDGSLSDGEKPSTSNWKLEVIPCQCSYTPDCECPTDVRWGKEPWGRVNRVRTYEENWADLSNQSSQPHDITGKHIEAEGIASSFSSTCSTASLLSNCASSDTSSYNSECQDEVEVALAVIAAELRISQEARAKFRSSADLVHRLFVCIAGVADQLQTNFAGDLRNILKAVFLIHSSDKSDYQTTDDPENECCERGEDAVEWGERETETPPSWVPDQEAPACMACFAPFTVVRRRHHCRNCGKIFCARCSSNSVPLPRYGHLKPVRVCNRCFIYQVTPFTLEDNIPTAN
ncbi:lateral signaling target protein 2 homolog isoform X2 [Halyomorpha halys]|uniref:lateral signaling target protein 2 homolog isoform X2 n=1 Tax=Halyomorpha halys TaxID=286706 RepID=UPI0034D15C8C